VKALKAADRHPVATLTAISLATYVGLLIWSWLRSDPLLLARAVAADRVTVYGQLAASAVAMLAVTLTVLAILVALPDRPGVEELRDSGSWPRLQGTLLASALLCLVTLVTGHLGVALDNKQTGKPWLELAAITAASMAVISVIVCGVVFALFLHVAPEPEEPSKGRGE
jgi:hypothetical protein